MEVYFRQKKMQTIMIYYNIIYCNKNIPMVRQNDEIRSHNCEIKSILDYFRSRNISVSYLIRISKKKVHSWVNNKISRRGPDESIMAGLITGESQNPLK